MIKIKQLQDNYLFSVEYVNYKTNFIHIFIPLYLKKVLFLKFTWDVLKSSYPCMLIMHDLNMLFSMQKKSKILITCMDIFLYTLVGHTNDHVRRIKLFFYGCNNNKNSKNKTLKFMFWKFTGMYKFLYTTRGHTSDNVRPINLFFCECNKRKKLH